jgi:monofunctional glycosyltransferase
MFLSKEKTMLRKIKEAIITIRIEKNLSKTEILERYLNVVQFGKNIFGIKSASQFYFKKLPSQLTLSESAFLTFLLPSPENYSRSYFMKDLTPFALGRLNHIIESLYQYQRITQDEYSRGIYELSYFFKNEPNLEPLPADMLLPEEDEETEVDEGWLI